MSATKFTVVLIVLLIIIGILSGTVAYFASKYKEVSEKPVIVNLSQGSETVNRVEPPKYPFINEAYSDYICDLCAQMDLDSDLVVAILEKENPEFDEKAMNANSNGTIDCGLFQLNDKYIWLDFVPNYWNINEVEFNPFLWKHNALLAISHIKYLSDKLKITDEVIMAYNCGLSAVINDEIPRSTKKYLSDVKNTMSMLKHEK